MKKVLALFLVGSIIAINSICSATASDYSKWAYAYYEDGTLGGGTAINATATIVSGGAGETSGAVFVTKGHMEQWNLVYKPFGWQVLDKRYGGLLTGIKTAQYRIKKYLNDEVDNLPELDEKRLYFCHAKRESGLTVCISRFSQMAIY